MTSESRLVVAIGPSSFAEADPLPLHRLARTGVEIRSNHFKRRLTEDETIELLQGVHGLVAGLESLNRRVLTASRDTLRAVARVGIGMENVDQAAARELGILVSNTPDGPTDAVAEMTLAALLSIGRRLGPASADLHKRQWTKHMGVGLAGTAVLLVGFGRIGRRVAQLLQTFQAEILFTDPDVPAVPAGFDFCRRVALAEGLAAADVISLHASGAHVLLGEKEFSAMKPGVVLLNAARGGLIDESALVGGLRAGLVSTAWLDVFPEEPYTGALCDFPQVLLTPHMATYTRQCRRRMELEAVDNLLRDLGLVQCT
jgi:D-3-phosphoglycerate dehydrogenase